MAGASADCNRWGQLAYTEPMKPIKERIRERWRDVEEEEEDGEQHWCRPLEGMRSIVALVALEEHNDRCDHSTATLKAHHGTETRVLLSAIRITSQTPHTPHTHTHTHTEAKEKLQTGARANSKDVRLSILTGVTGNNLNRFSQRSTKLCIYIPSHKSTARPPVPSARTFLFSLFLSLACMYTTAHFGDRLE